MKDLLELIISIWPILLILVIGGATLLFTKEKRTKK